MQQQNATVSNCHPCLRTFLLFKLTVLYSNRIDGLVPAKLPLSLAPSLPFLSPPPQSLSTLRPLALPTLLASLPRVKNEREQDLKSYITQQPSEKMCKRKTRQGNRVKVTPDEKIGVERLRSRPDPDWKRDLRLVNCLI
jgi:hypothetical protein